jgi:dihydrolipoamide dehydrogenase
VNQETFDIAIIGGGPGGYTAAIRAAQVGLRTAIVERDKLGGVCLNWGCIPTKALLKNAELLNAFRKAEEWGISYENLRIDFNRIIKRSRVISEKISKGVEFLMKKNKVASIAGSARLTGKGMIEISADGKPREAITAKHIVLATGSRPRSVPGIQIDRKRIITSMEGMSLAHQPESMVIIGAGAIGVEFAYFYNALGTKVTLVEMMEGILPVEDREITKLMESSLKKQGIEVLTGTRVESVKSTPDYVTVGIIGATGKRDLKASMALVAVGVQGNVENLGLEELGVAVER